MANDMTLAFRSAGIRAGDCRPTPVCDPRPVCPACGGLECLCRPRFFAGQLLTEEDLNRLDHYIVAKNKLHNRYLFGSGVVCGLDVVCSVCDPGGNSTVIVKPGYALSPCGNDIVVCQQESVNVCDLIDQCRPRTDDCYQQPRPAADDDRDKDGAEHWVLAICYQEKPSRGVTALRGSSCSCGGKSSCGCGCGGHGGVRPSRSGVASPEASCGCGGGGAKTSTMKPAPKAGPRPPQCEPTQICEGYSFAVYKLLPEQRQRQVDPGALIKRFICCLVPLFEQLPQLPGNNPTQKDFQDWLTNFIAAVREFLITEGLYDCDVVAKIGAVVVPVPGRSLQQYLNKWVAALIAVLEILAAIFQKCLCAALLPPCPPSEMNDCVPIATLTVSRGRCHVHHICNISNRRFLMTWPAIQYWLSWLPLFSTWFPQASTLRKLIEGICCTPIAGVFGFAVDNVKFVREAPPPGAPAVRRGLIEVAGRPAKDLHPFTELLAESLFSDRKVDAPTLLLAALGATNKDGSPLASDVALQYPGQAMLIHQVLGPALEPLLPLAGALASGRADTTALERSIEALKQRVDEQQATIDRLRNR